MELAIIIYLIGLFDSISIVAATTFGLVCVICFICAIDRIGGMSEKVSLPFSLRPALAALVCFWIVALALPSESTAKLMLAAYAGQSVSEMEEAQQIGSKAYTALNKILDDFIEEPTP